uniref:XS domain-containing protein n=1 Tax=Rhizophora mucronata TaxID=61149 RepID=A0A2P2JYG4_RHIMU
MMKRVGVGHTNAISCKMDRSPSPHGHLRRSLSPCFRMKMDGSRKPRILLSGADKGKNSSTERREEYAFALHSGTGRTERVVSGNKSPRYMLDRDRHKPHVDVDDDQRVAQRKYKYVEHLNYDDDRKSNRLKQVYGYDHHGGSSRLSDEWVYSGKSCADMERHGITGQKSVHVEDGMTRGPYQMPLRVVPTSTYGETGRHLPFLSRDVDDRLFEREKLHYQDPIPSERIQLTKYYKQNEEPVFHSRDVSYNKIPASLPKIFEVPAQFNDFAGTSSGTMECEFPNSYRKGVPLPTSDYDCPRSHAEFMQPVHSNKYYQRSVVGMRDLEAGKIDYPQGAYSPKRVINEDYLDPKRQRLVNDDNLHRPDDLFRMIPPHSQLDFEHPVVYYEHKELSRLNTMNPFLDKIDHAKNSYENTRKNAAWAHSNIENLADTEDHKCAKDSREYLGSGYTQVEFERIESRENETSLSGFTQDDQISHVRSDYGFGREASPEFQKEILQDPMPTYDREILRQRMQDEFIASEPSDKVLKRKYIMGEDMVNHDARTIMSSKWYRPEESEDLYDSGEEWIAKDTSFLHASRAKRFDHSAYRKGRGIYNSHGQLGDPASDNWFSQDSLAHARRHSAINYKPAVKYIKGHPRPSSLSLYKSHQTDKRSGIHRRHRIWKRNHECNEDERENDDDQSEDWTNIMESEPTEDSEEFQQLVDKAFLDYSKRLNLNSSVRRRYKEQGKAGSLFCIVCGRSSSKEFVDTQRLVTHAFMSHKAGLRVQHLGLHKAICVMMGWNSYVSCDTITWVPEVLPKVEALAQKENLILWPPVVVIRNISMSNDNPEQQKVIPLEGVRSFLRGETIYLSVA